MFGYVRDVSDDEIKAVFPYVIGHLVEHDAVFAPRLSQDLQLHLEDIDQFSTMDHSWTLTMRESKSLENYPEKNVKTLIGGLLGEHEIPKDWDGEEADVFAATC